MNPNADKTQEAIVITEANIDRVIFGEGIVWTCPRNAKTGFGANMTNRWGNFAFNVKVDFKGASMRDVLHHAGVDIKSNCMNNVRPKFDSGSTPGDSAAVLSAKKTTLQRWTTSKLAVFRFVERARNVYDVDPVDKVKAQIASDKLSAEDLLALQAAIEAKLAQSQNS